MFNKKESVVYNMIKCDKDRVDGYLNKIEQYFVETTVTYGFGSALIGVLCRESEFKMIRKELGIIETGKLYVG